MLIDRITINELEKDFCIDGKMFQELYNLSLVEDIYSLCQQIEERISPFFERSELKVYVTSTFHDEIYSPSTGIAYNKENFQNILKGIYIKESIEGEGFVLCLVFTFFEEIKPYDKFSINNFIKSLNPIYRKLVKTTKVPHEKLVNMVFSLLQSKSLLELSKVLDSVQKIIGCEIFNPLITSSKQIYHFLRVKPSQKVNSIWNKHKDTILGGIPIFSSDTIIVFTKNDFKGVDFLIIAHNSNPIHRFCVQDYHTISYILPIIKKSVETVSLPIKHRRNSYSSNLNPKDILLSLNDEEILNFTSLNLFIPNLNDFQKNQLLYFIATEYDLFRLFNINESDFFYLLSLIQSKYKPNYYHNWSHAVSVVRSGYLMLKKSNLIIKFNKIERLSLFISSLCHDIDHKGFSNDELIKKKHPLGILYKGLSVMEFHHIHVMIELFEKIPPNRSILKSLLEEEINLFWEISIELIKVTDLSLNKIVYPLFNELISKEIDFNNFENKFLILKLIIKSSDLYTICSPIEIYKKWSILVFRERFNIDPENEEKTAPNELWFLNNICKPLYEYLYKFNSIFIEELNQINSNINYWNSKIK